MLAHLDTSLDFTNGLIHFVTHITFVCTGRARTNTFTHTRFHKFQHLKHHYVVFLPMKI